MTDLATLGFRIDASQLRSGQTALKQFGDEGARTDRRIGQSTDRISGAITSMSALAIKSLAGVAAGFAGLAAVGAAVRGISQFEASISRLGAISGATETQLASMRGIAMDLGSSTEFSAGQAADALNFLAMAGFDAAEGMAAIPDVLDLATAAQLDLARAADISSNIMSAFGIAASDAGAVADVLAAASSRANTDVGQLGEAMKFVGPVASALEIAMNDTAAAIGVLSDAGIQGGSAGTGLRRVLSSLANPSNEAAKALGAMGLQLDALDPATTSIVDIVGQLADAGLSAADALTIFGDRGGPAILALVSQADSLRELTGELADVEGAASDMAETMRDNLGGDIKGLMSAIEGLILSLGDAGLTAVLRGAVAVATIFVRGFSAAIGVFADFASGSEQSGTAIDNATLAMGDQITQANALFTLMGTGATMSQSMALAKLSEAEAHLRVASALQDEKDELVALQMAQLSLNYADQQDALASTRVGTDAYEERERAIASILQQMGSLRDIQNSADADFTDAASEVTRIRAAIANAVDGMVIFDGEVIAATDLSDRLVASMSSVADAVSYRAVPSMVALRGEYGALAPVMRDVIAAQNALAAADLAASFVASVDGVRSLEESLKSAGHWTAELALATADAMGASNFDEMAAEAVDLANALANAAGGAQFLTGDVREAYLALLDAASGAAEVAGQTYGAAAAADHLTQRVAMIAGAFAPAVGAAGQLAAVLGGVVGRIGQVASGLARLSGLSGALSSMQGVASGALANITGGFSGAANSLSALWDSSMLQVEAGWTPPAPVIPDLPGGGGGGGGGSAAGGGGGGSSAQTEMMRDLERAIEDARTPLQVFNDEMADLRDLAAYAEAQGVDFGQAYEHALEEITDRYHDALDAAAALNDETKKGVNTIADFFGAIASGADGVLDLLADVLQQMAQVQIMKGVLGFANASPAFAGFAEALGGALTMPSFDGGGYTGSGARSGGMDGKGGFPAILHPNETVIDHTKNGGATAAPVINQTINQSFGTVNGDDHLRQVARQETARGIQEANRQLPEKIAAYSQDRRKR